MSDSVTILPVCLHCGKTLKGRLDKKFCNASCKNAYNNHLQRQERLAIVKIDLILKHNRRILKQCMDLASTRLVSKTELLQKGFYFEYFTHQVVDLRQDYFYFCYDYGYRLIRGEMYRIAVVDHLSMPYYHFAP